MVEILRRARLLGSGNHQVSRKGRSARDRHCHVRSRTYRNLSAHYVHPLQRLFTAALQ
jgi:hypothetical protein